jgi:hypothetical protein
MRAPGTSHRERTSAQQVRELGALISTENSVHFRERNRDGGLDTFGALDPFGSRSFRGVLVERLGREGVCQTGSRAALIDSGLRPFGLERIQDRRKLGGLRIVEVELEGEKPEGTPDAEATRRKLVPAPSVRCCVPPPMPAPKPAWRARTGVCGSAIGLVARGVSARMPPGEHSRMHFSISSPGLIAPGGFADEATGLMRTRA